MTSKILCAVDGTDHSHVALLAAIDLAARLKVKLSICAVNVVYGTSPRSPQVPVWTSAEAQKILADAIAIAVEHGLQVTDAAVVTSREASTGIIDFAIDHAVDHIFVGSGGKRGLARLFLGSAAADLAARAPCSVTIAR